MKKNNNNLEKNKKKRLDRLSKQLKLNILKRKKQKKIN